MEESLPAWSEWFEQLAESRRAGCARIAGRTFWVAAERARLFTEIFPDAQFDSPLPDIVSVQTSRGDAVYAMIRGWIGHAGPVSAKQLASLLGLQEHEIDQAFLRLEAGGVILRGKFTDPHSEQTEWCERRLLARIHRLTLGELRKEIQSVTPAQFMNWLLRWQHVAFGSQLLGERGTLEAVQQMQGFEAPANSWESQILKRRVADFDSKMLDQLCLTGAVGWGRLSPHPATLEPFTDARRRVIPTRIAPITFFVRDDADWMMPRHEESGPETRGLSATASGMLQFLRQRGASFFADVVRSTGRLKSEVEMALWELVAAGLLTADGFDNLRALIDPKRRSGQGSGKNARPRHSAGRWSLLHSGEIRDRAKSLEAICWMLLRRYGIVFRELLTRESILPKWREILVTLRRLEDRGEVRGGRFVSGFLGEQFALPVAVESLRALRQQQPSGELTTISAADPLNLVGIIVPGERVAANSGRLVAFRDGVAVSDSETPKYTVLPITGT
jgi:ATP-dependent helicase Lhr and Lhr-like helicase